MTGDSGRQKRVEIGYARGSPCSRCTGDVRSNSVGQVKRLLWAVLFLAWPNWPANRNTLSETLQWNFECQGREQPRGQDEKHARGATSATHRRVSVDPPRIKIQLRSDDEKVDVLLRYVLVDIFLQLFHDIIGLQVVYSVHLKIMRRTQLFGAERTLTLTLMRIMFGSFGNERSTHKNEGVRVRHQSSWNVIIRWVDTLSIVEKHLWRRRWAWKHSNSKPAMH